MNLILGADLQGLIAANAAAIPANFVNIPGGTFRMGAADIGKVAKPVHEVAVSSFRMGKYPVTVEEYQALVGRLEANRFALLSGSEGRKPGVVTLAGSAEELGKVKAQDLLGKLTVADLIATGGTQLFSELKVVELTMPNLDSEFAHPRKPMVDVDWYESVLHALLRGALLATEAQWEYAATGGGISQYGTSSGKLRKKEAHYQPHSQGTTAEVGTYPANAWGLHEMTGNVWEWCADLFGKYSAESQRDPVGPANGHFRVMRGGSWDDGRPDGLRAAYRSGAFGPELRYGAVGFRLVAPQDSPV